MPNATPALLPERLYKYLSAEYAHRVVARGELLFRNLAYFRKSEHAARGDPIEGVHVDQPEHLTTVEAVGSPVRSRGRHAFHNFVDQEKVFAFCLSTVLDARLFKAFNSDCCVEIKDVEQLLWRCRTALRRVLPKSPFHHGPVEYYDVAGLTQMNVSDPTNIPFFKHERFQEQGEYRLVCSEGRGLTVTTRIVNSNFSFDEEVVAAQDRELLLRIGSIAHMAEVISKPA